MKKNYDFSRTKQGPVLKAQPDKTRITIRIDSDILEWFRKRAHEAGGASYQTMINDALRLVMGSRRESLEATLRRVLREEIPGLRKASSG